MTGDASATVLEPERLGPLARPAVVLALLTALLGVVALIGWAVDSPVLTRVLPGLVAMQPSTAADFVLLGLGTAVMQSRVLPSRRAASMVALVAVALVLVIAGAGLVTETQQVDYPFTFLADMSQNGGRMSGITAVGHLTLTVSLLCLVLRRPEVAHGTAVAGVAIGLMGLSGYAFGPSDLYGVGYFQTLALHTALGITTLGLALVMATGNVGLVRLARSRTTGGRLVRTLLPAVVLVPLATGWLGVRAMREGAGPGFVVACLVTGVALFSGAMVWAAGAQLRQADVRRAEAERDRHEAEVARAEAQLALEQLAAADEELRIANRDLRDFTSATVHDLRGPLSAIQLGSQMLELTSSEETRAKVEERIRTAVARGMALVDDLLDLQQVGTVDPESTDLDVVAMVSAHATTVSDQTGRAVHLDLVGADDVTGVHADEQLVRRLVGNLVENAVKYTPGDDAVDLALRTSTREEMVEVRIADRGVPIAEEERETVFEIFRRGTEGARVAPGTGVGLAICRRIVERHGGEIHIQDEAGWSKSFAFTLPCAGGVEPGAEVAPTA
ncbi:sensor histidine kinase [Nocardioides bruguierae]|uniref:Sensor-like histidine kinase SenX3 n=1 Tax=Nocardioides bruguierae TaxID=2945102 RepID=A0A9X2DBC5_9ACTN|nr:HAMP domain-containing sensor histidine kinase [Nocardioides bruguierae]MCM0622474.1 HAMP domain-containing histidine kinase [Nocardioides bruguierae]